MTKFRYNGKDKAFAKRMGFDTGGPVPTQVRPGVYSPMQPGETYNPQTSMYQQAEPTGGPPVQNNGPPLSDANGWSPGQGTPDVGTVPVPGQAPS